MIRSTVWHNRVASDRKVTDTPVEPTASMIRRIWPRALLVLSVLLPVCAGPMAMIASDDAIVHAAFNGDLAAVEGLIKAGADVNFKVNEGGTALMMASQRGHTEVVRALLKGGADVNATDNSGVTALMLASEKGHVDVVRALLKGGADVDIRSEYGATALSMASGRFSEEVVRLLQKGAKQ